MTDNTLYEEKFTKRLTQLRLAKGVSAREMSLSLGQNENYINNIENGVALPKMMPFFYICEYLDITPLEFFDFDDQNPIQSNELTREINKLNAHQIEIIENIVREFRKKK